MNEKNKCQKCDMQDCFSCEEQEEVTREMFRTDFTQVLERAEALIREAELEEAKEAEREDAFAEAKRETENSRERRHDSSRIMEATK